MRLPVLCLLLFSCAGNTSIPKEVIQPKKMQAVLYDVIRADEWVDFYSLQDSTFRPFSKRTALYDSIFHIHAITKDGFQKSLQFYQQHPDLLKPILDSLQKQADTITTVKPNTAL